MQDAARRMCELFTEAENLLTESANFWLNFYAWLVNWQWRIRTKLVCQAQLLIFQ